MDDLFQFMQRRGKFNPFVFSSNFYRLMWNSIDFYMICRKQCFYMLCCFRCYFCCVCISKWTMIFALLTENKWAKVFGIKIDQNVKPEKRRETNSKVKYVRCLSAAYFIIIIGIQINETEGIDYNKWYTRMNFTCFRFIQI